MERRKVNSIEEIYNRRKLIIKDFSNLDLEGLDLSKIPKRAWKNCIFDNTSFKNTGIKFDLKKLKYIHTRTPYSKAFKLIKNCDFSNNDLRKVFKNIKNQDVEFVSCNFTNTNISETICGYNNTLDSSCDFYNADPPHSGLDCKTAINSPSIELDTSKIMWLIEDIYRHEKRKEGIKLFKQLLEHKDASDIKRMYNKLKKVMTDEEIFEAFAKQEIWHKKFQKIFVSNKEKNMLNRIGFSFCKFDKVVINDEDYQIFSNDFYYTYRKLLGYSNKVENIVFPKLKYNSWRFNNIDKRLIDDITFRTNLYLELGRMCNAKCEFCRNSYYCDYKYDYDSILKSLREVIPKLDSIVIGGGEPTLVLKDLKRLIKDIQPYLDRHKTDLYLFTNGTCKYIDKELAELNNGNINYNISRHAVDDKENARIFGVSEDKIMSTAELTEFMERTEKTTLAATCFKGGLDTKEKVLEYIDYALSIGCESILLSDLMVMEDDLLKNKDSYQISINPKVFESVSRALENRGYNKSKPIVTTGGYILTMFKRNGVNISIKHYVSKKELESMWPSATKRTFDLSIDPNGDLYENWHQTSGLVKTQKKK